jgi:hypothetical protein
LVLQIAVLIITAFQQNFVQGIHDLLQQTLSGDNEKIKIVSRLSDITFISHLKIYHVNQATQRLNQEYYKSPNAIPALANIVASSPDRSVR